MTTYRKIALSPRQMEAIHELAGGAAIGDAEAGMSDPEANDLELVLEAAGGRTWKERASSFLSQAGR